ncbi:peptidylprolyl isomerase [Roseibium sp. HPY-6]|uniref:peptidylprolyl isomerase n=1 Tax=Roseibium sp. HPY-6 TaxID=3229852 RepID=UPI00338FA1F1
MRLRFVPLILGLVLAFAAPVTTPSHAAIKVTVNDVPITDYDINQRARLITLTQRKPASVARRQAEQELIDDQVKLAEADRMGIDIAPSQVDNAFNNIARNVKMSPSQLSKALRSGGVKPETLKARLKAQLAWNQLLQRRFRGQIEVDESDIIAALQKKDEAERQKSVEYDLKRVIVVVPKNSSGGFKSKRRQESNKIRSAFNSCDDAGTILGQYSEVVVQPIGRRLETELPENVREEINSLSPGSLTKPSATPVGFEMIAICGKREIASDIAVRAELENELRAKEGESQSRRYLMDVRRRATIIHR